MKAHLYKDRFLFKTGAPFYFIFISSILTMISLTFFDLCFLAWICEIFLILYFVRNDMNAKKAFKGFFLYGIVFNLTFLHWLFNLHPLTWKGYTWFESISLTLLAWLSLSIFESLFYAVIGFVAFLFKPKRPVIKGFLVILVILLTEWSRSVDVWGFPWARLAVSQYKNLAFIQSASLFGILFVSFIILSVNLCLALTIHNLIEYRIKRSALCLLAAFVVFFSNMAYGDHELKHPSDSIMEMNISIIQGNVSVDNKWTAGSNGESIKDKHFRLTREAYSIYPQSKIILWAETALPTNLTTHPEILDEISELSAEINLLLIIGAIMYDENGGLRNSIISVDNSGIGDIYYKRHPVPFGEYIPLKDLVYEVFPKARDSKIAGEGLVAGSDSNLIDIYGYKLGALVCYDSIFPHLAVDAVRDGANVLFVASNDSWYKRSVALRQHNAQSVFRAVETRRYLIRAANTGISCIISDYGEIDYSSPVNVEYILNGNVKLNGGKTLYVRTGDIFIYLASIVFIFLVFTPLIQIKKNRKNKIKHMIR